MAARDEQFKQRFEMLDQRLDNIDSIVTNLVERVMRQPVTIELVCPKCDNVIQIMLTSSTKTGGKRTNSV
ncbi:MAG: hypothetical protein FJZ85_06290 [Chloroflexi bacterium]|nr:hypothetical protein [Chloroflexota bacterium]MBM3173299.1 hypothetical protein [Chloroflexota bacterium]MBM3175225.1 hypothetical protein [Chloroflexota bacterium]MBM4451250.1 hypothetical protein [Chloroflexota bacterium]